MFTNVKFKTVKASQTPQFWARSPVLILGLFASPSYILISILPGSALCSTRINFPKASCDCVTLSSSPNGRPLPEGPSHPAECSTQPFITGLPHTSMHTSCCCETFGPRKNPPDNVPIPLSPLTEVPHLNLVTTARGWVV